jgi:hypothetical protein
VHPFGSILPMTLTKDAPGGNVHIEWSGGLSPYTLTRAEDPQFLTNPTVLVDRQPVTTFDDPVLADGKTYYYEVE